MKKRFWKKALSLAMAGVTALSLAACGGGEKPAATTQAADSKATEAPAVEADVYKRQPYGSGTFNRYVYY